MSRAPTSVMTESTPWSCPSCLATAGDGAYCQACGERRVDAHDQKLSGVLHEWFESLVHVDGRIVRSCRELLAAPGSLTAANLAGRRRPYLAPFQLFLAMNVVFFVTQSLTGLSILSIPLAEHLQQGWYGELAKRLLDSRLAHLGLPYAAFAPRFDHQGQVIAKSLVILMIPLLAACLAALLYRLRRTGPTHLLFATHFYGYMLLCLTLLFPLAALLLRALGAMGWHFEWSRADDVITIVEVGAIAWYFARALPRVYGLRGGWLAAACAASVVATILVLDVYRALQFGLTLLTA